VGLTSAPGRRERAPEVGTVADVVIEADVLASTPVEELHELDAGGRLAHRGGVRVGVTPLDRVVEEGQVRGEIRALLGAPLGITATDDRAPKVPAVVKHVPWADRHDLRGSVIAGGETLIAELQDPAHGVSVSRVLSLA